jgi:hypothetical protein
MRVIAIGIGVAAALTACGTSGGGAGGGGDDQPPAMGAPGPYFEQPMFFNRDVTGIDPSPQSGAMIQALKDAGGWGNGNKMQIDFGFDVLAADSSTPHRAFTRTDDFYTPDCDFVDVPVPPNGNIEGEDGYECTSGDDCHLLVFDHDAHTLYEMWKANITSSTSFQGGCLVAWDTSATYPASLRGDQCTSADAAGFPIAPLLFTADEVAAGKIDHAIRFIVPNDRPRADFYSHPATHGGGTTGSSTAPPYGMHLRLRGDFNVDSLPSEGAKVVARAMQKYGMYHADGGNIALTGQSDRYTQAKWDGLLDPHDLASLKVDDFEVIDEGAMIELTNQCDR